MFRALTNLFRKDAPPMEPFVDQTLGEFEFDRDLGWKKQIVLGNRQVELVLGSNGEYPSDQMLSTARQWVAQWPAQLPKIIAYIRRELRERSDVPNLPEAEKFEVESINILWKDQPRMSMIYFTYPGDDIRLWHVTFEEFEPRGYAYDD